MKLGEAVLGLNRVVAVEAGRVEAVFGRFLNVTSSSTKSLNI
jgi:hypothetical protein